MTITMYFSTTHFITIITYAACAAFTAAADSADCFKQEGDRYSKSADGATRTSAGVICPDSAPQSCPVVFGGFVNAASTLNITTGAVDKVFAAVAKAPGGDTKFPKSIYGSVGNGTQFIKPGEIGYYAFTITLLCYAGELVEDCAADAGVPNGTAVEACRAETLGDENQYKDGVPNLLGTPGFVTSDRETVANMTTNPAAQIRPNSDSWAVKLGPGNGVLMAVSVVMGLSGWLFF